MGRQIGILLQGMVVVVPTILTMWVLWGSVSWLDGKMRLALGTIPYLETFPGLGIVTAIGLIYVVGLLTRLWLFRKGLGFADRMIRRVPLVKTLYGSLRDMFQFFGGDGKKAKGAAVRVDVGPMGHMIGVSTGATTPDADRVGVYLPLSYQIGGFLVYVPKERIAPAGMSVEEALKLVLTGGMGMDTNQDSLGDKAEPTSD